MVNISLLTDHKLSSAIANSTGLGGATSQTGGLVRLHGSCPTIGGRTTNTYRPEGKVLMFVLGTTIAEMFSMMAGWSRASQRGPWPKAGLPGCQRHGRFLGAAKDGSTAAAHKPRWPFFQQPVAASTESTKRRSTPRADEGP